MKKTIDRGKLRDAVRRMGDEYAFYLLIDALEIIPDAKLAKLVGRYIRLEQIETNDDAVATDIFSEVKTFEVATLTGKYYESFNVNSQNYMSMSGGTRAWIADCCRLFERLVAQPKNADHERVVLAFEILFGLLRRLDDGSDELIFFADEGGSWIVAVDWKTVLPAYFARLAKVAEPEDYARRAKAAIALDKPDSTKYLALAEKAATAAQRKSLRSSSR